MDYFDQLSRVLLAFPSASVAVVVVILTIVYYVIQMRNLPPGPMGLPYFGYWPFINNENAHLKLDALKKKYGDIFSITVTGRLFLNLGSIKAVREAHITKGDCFESRINDYTLFLHIFEDGVAFSKGEKWRVQRKFFLQAMKERGVKAFTTILSGSLDDLVQSTVDDLRALKGQRTDIIEMLTNKCTTTLRLTLFGDAVSEKQIADIIRLYEVVVTSMTTINSLLVGKFVKYFVFPFKPEVRAAFKSFQKMRKLLYEIIEEHESTFNEENIRDVIDEYIRERNIRKQKGDPTAEYFSNTALMGSLFQIIGDGVLSVSFFASVMIKSLIEHPDEQDRILQELTEVVGAHRLPSIDDKPKLSYINAFLQEVMRTADVFPLFASLECTKETTLRGYRIPKGTITLINFWSSHYDPEVYAEPQKFNPSRFISKGDKRKEELPIMFGIGKRACLGEGFVMTQLFLFLSAIIKNFQLTLPEDEKVTYRELFQKGKLEIFATPRNQK